MSTRNRLPDASEHQPRFNFTERQPNGFTIFDTYGQQRRAVDFDLLNDQIIITCTPPAPTTTVHVTVTLNDDGLCRFRIYGDELDSWQVLKRVLERLFFEPDVSTNT